MKDQLIDAWCTHQKMNLLLIENITDEGLQKTLSTRNGRTVYQQLVHLHNVRMQWLEICSKEIFRKYKVLDKNSKPEKKMIKKSLEDSAKGIEELLSKSWDSDGKVKGFKKGVIPMLGYFISHESHHRGNILLTLKQCGIKIPDSLKWGLWEWGK